MKRSWKNFRLDKNKVYTKIGQAVVYSSLYIATLVFSYLMFLSGTTYQEGKMTKEREEKLKKLGISDYEIEEVKEQNRKEKVLLIIAILNWLNVILMLIFIIIRSCNYQEGKMEENNKKPNGLQWFALGFSVASLIVALFKQSNYRNNYCDY